MTAAIGREFGIQDAARDAAQAGSDRFQTGTPEPGRVMAASGVISVDRPGLSRSAGTARIRPGPAPSSALRRTAGAADLAPVGLSVTPEPLFLHRRERNDHGDHSDHRDHRDHRPDIANQPIRRLHDPVVTPVNNPQAIAYITTQTRTLVDGLKNAVVAHEMTTDDDTVTAFAVEAVRAGAVPRRDNTDQNVAAATALLQQTLQGHPPNPPQPEAVLALAIRALNYAEHEAATSAALANDVQDVLIGTEFSFGDQREVGDEKSSRHLKIDPPRAKPNETAEEKETRLRKYDAPRTHATSVIAEWAAAARGAADKIPGTPRITVANYAGKGGFPAKKITYRFENAQPAWEWFWVADIDEACYETQTKPTSVKDLDKPEIKAIISSHIFGCAKTVKLRMQHKGEGLTPDPTVTGGGGHLSFDVGTAFSGAGGAVSAELVMGTLETLQQKADMLSTQFRKDDRGNAMQQPNDRGDAMENIPSDVKNAPSLSGQAFNRGKVAQVQGLAIPDDTRPLDYYSQLIKAKTQAVLRGAPVDLANIQQALVKLNRLLTNTATQPGEEKTHLEEDANISHYQAINIEHLHDVDPTKQRIEVRDIPAQTDHAKLMRDLKALTAILEEAKEVVRLEQQARLLGAST